jgi:hypothetical protein
MLSVSFNIVSGNGSVLTNTPQLWVLNNFREFTDAIRDNTLRIANYAARLAYNVKGLELHVSLYEDINSKEYYKRNFVIKCKGIREYNNYINMSNEEINNLILQKEREEKINDGIAILIEVFEQKIGYGLIFIIT